MPETPRRLEQIFSGLDPALYFVTFNTHKRARILASADVQARFVDFASRVYRVASL